MSDVVIPPATIVTGPISYRIPEIVARVTTNLHGSASDATWIQTAIDAAILFVIERTNRAAVGLPGDALTVNGIVIFAERIYTDSFNPNGAQVAVADASFDPVFQPENLYRHVRHYFNRLNPAWGVA